MKRAFWLSICLLLTLAAQTQIQQGYVKTKGRLGANGTVVAGSRIAGASVTVRGGNAVVSKTDGAFSLGVPAGKFYLQNVQKQGYVLTDPDVLSKQYAFSPNPLVLVMETPTQQANDKLATERKIRHALQRQLQEREDELEALKEQNRITEDAWRQQIQELYNQHDNNERLISNMAERYSKMDFDEVDEFNRRISKLILDGHLTEADSLLNTKGDIRQRIASLLRERQLQDKEHVELQRRQKELLLSQAGTQHLIADVGHDCYTRHEIHKLNHQLDSAATYLCLRADLDTTNIAWQLDAAQFLVTFMSLNDEAENYAACALNQCTSQGMDAEDVTAEAHMLMGEIYNARRNVEEATSHYAAGAQIIFRRYGLCHPTVAEYLYQILPKTAPNRAGFLLMQYEYQLIGHLIDSLKINGQHVSPYSCIYIWEQELLQPTPGTDTIRVLNRLGDCYFYFRKDIETATHYYARAYKAYKQRDGLYSFGAGRMMLRQGDLAYSLLRKWAKEKEQDCTVQNAEKHFATLALHDLAEAANILCYSVGPRHREVALALDLIATTYETLRDTPCNADSIYASASPSLARFQNRLKDLHLWDEELTSDKISNGKRQDLYMASIWSRRRMLSQWATIWYEMENGR